MNKKCIDAFMFNNNLDVICGRNYAGLVGAIYLFTIDPGYIDKKNAQTFPNYIYDCISTGAFLTSDNNFKQNPLNTSALILNGIGEDPREPDEKKVISHSLKIPIDAEKSSFTCKSQGQKNGKTFLSELNIVLKERSVQVSELFVAMLQTHSRFGIVFQDANGDFRIIADPYYDMEIETSEETGEGPTGNSVSSFKISQVSKIPPIYYRGKLYFNYMEGNIELAEGGEIGYVLCDSGIYGVDYVERV